MLTTSCPSCGSPLTFASGAALTAICPACHSCVVREGEVVRNYGRIAVFQRDLSPIQLDARGKLGERSFRVAGVLRRARARVRWNEWYVVFDDGGDGWIGEGNGQWFAYAEAQEVSPHVVHTTGAGGKLEAAGAVWRVMEDASASIVAADGQLPFPVVPHRVARYLDLREEGGSRVATLDLADEPPTLWIGRDVTLLQLQMEGLRPFAGWSDPALVHFAGPEVTEVRSLRCDACGASNAVRAPGQTQRLACAYCGSVLAVDAGESNIEAQLLDRRTDAGFDPLLPLGSRGTLKGIDWVVIGAMVRSVFADGQEWAWTEYLLHNPYRGFAWLVHDTQAHWSFVEALRGELPQGDDRARTWRGRRFRRFQTGHAQVKHVLGEFTWEVALGDRAYTADFVDPPTMLSFERTDEEVTWSVGTWLPVDEVAKGFKAKLPPAYGVAPHQPNPHKGRARITSVIVRGLLLFAVSAFLLAWAIVTPDRAPLFSHEFLVVSGDNAWVTDPVVLAEEQVVELTLDSSLPTDPDITVSLINAETGQVWDWTTYGDATATARLGPGTWNGRVALPAPPADSDAGRMFRLSALRDPAWVWPAGLLFFWSILAPIAYWLDVSSFETRRWQNAGDS